MSHGMLSEDDHKSLVEVEATPVMIRPGSKQSMGSATSSWGRQSAAGTSPTAAAAATKARTEVGEAKEDAGARTVGPDTEAKVLARVAEFSGKLIPEEMEKLSETGQACAKAGAKAGAEAGATAGMTLFFQIYFLRC
jgi:hypothetical protein